MARTRRWSVAGDQILCCEYNVPAVRVLLEGEKSSGLLPTWQGVYHGAYTLYKYNTSDLLRNFKKLYNLEKEYAKFNNGCGLKALEEAKKRLDYWQRVHPEQWGDHELLLEQWDNHELYSGQFEDYEEAGIMTIEKRDWRNIGDRMWDDERTLLFKDGSRGNRKSIREYLKKTSGESVGKGEGTKGNSIREQSRSCQDRYSS